MIGKSDMSPYCLGITGGLCGKCILHDSDGDKCILAAATAWSLANTKGKQKKDEYLNGTFGMVK